MGCLHAVRRNIGSRVSDRDMTQASGVHVVLHIASDSLDIRSRLVSSLFVIDDLVSREEGQSVVVLGEHLDCCEDALEVICVVRNMRIRTVDGVSRVVDIEDQVDACVGKSCHTLVVVGIIVNGIDTDRVDAEVSEFGNVTQANVGVCKRVDVGRGTARLVINTADIESLITGPES